jgi:uncharacterized protein
MLGPHPRELVFELESGGRTTALIYAAQSAARLPTTLILAHGAGAGQRHPFLVSLATELSGRGLDLVTFNFLYMEQQRRVPDRMPQLVSCYRAAIAAARQHVPSARERLFVGGKSMGGRAATHLAAESADQPAFDIRGIVLLGYPLHPPGRPDKPRDAHLPNVKCPMLFIQGSRDAFGTPSELKPVLGSLSPLPTLHTVHGGDHSFKVAGRDAKQKQAAVYEDIHRAILEWIGVIGRAGL